MKRMTSAGRGSLRNLHNDVKGPDSRQTQWIDVPQKIVSSIVRGAPSRRAYRPALDAEAAARMWP